MHERILGAAFQAFTEGGYAGTSTLDIATRAKVSKRDLDANFASKHAVLVACIQSHAEGRIPRGRGERVIGSAPEFRQPMRSAYISHETGALEYWLNLR